MNKINEKFVGLGDKIKKILRFLGFLVLAFIFSMLVWGLFAGLFLNKDSSPSFLGPVIFIFVLCAFKCLLPRLIEMKKDKKAWLKRVLSSLGGLSLRTRA